ncbi:MAG: glycosyltransferase [Bacteroidales bacterium]|nr:glycosyltransferase [Bacteroidales bacterium]
MERVMSELAGYFCNHSGIEVHLVLYGRAPALFYTTPRNITIHLPHSIFNDRLRLLSTLRRLLYLRRTISDIRPDSILSFGEYWNSFVLIALWGFPYHIFVSDRCSPEKKLGKVHDFLRKHLYRRAKGIIAQTKAAHDFYKDRIKHGNVVVIGNPIREINTTGGRKEKIVLTVGRLITSKNHDKLIRVFCGLKMEGWKLIVVGGDALRQNNMNRYNKLVVDLQAESSVTITGNQVDTDHYYKRSLIFAFASESEGFPNVIGEAMSAGLPVVAFDCIAGPSEMITHGVDGFLVKVGDYASFGEHLELLMSDDRLRKDIGERARGSIKQFSIENIGTKYLQFIFGK